MIDVAGLGYAHDRMDQQTAADLLCRSLGQFLVGAVHRVVGLESDDPGPTQVLEVPRNSAGVRRSSTKS